MLFTFRSGCYMMDISNVAALGYRGHGFDSQGVYSTKKSKPIRRGDYQISPKLIPLKPVRNKTNSVGKHTKING